MESKKHKRKTNHVVIVTSDAVDANVKQFRIKPWVLWFAVVTLCVLIGAGLGYLIYEEQIWGAANKKIDEYKAQAKKLEQQLEEQQVSAEEERDRLENEIERLEKEKGILGDTVNMKDAEVMEMAAQIEKMYKPTMLPLTGGATIEEVGDGEPMCLFNASEGALVVATASGTVTEIIEEPEYGYKVTVDHGNGYITIYRNVEVPKVKQDEAIVQGVTIFVVDKSSLKLGYQIIKDGVYINPMEIMEIDG